MRIGRMILTNSVLTLVMLGTPQAANITVAGATNFPMPGKRIAALFRQKNRHDTILSFGASGEHIRQINKSCYFSCFAQAHLARTASCLPNPAWLHVVVRLCGHPDLDLDR